MSGLSEKFKTILIKNDFFELAASRFLDSPKRMFYSSTGDGAERTRKGVSCSIDKQSNMPFGFAEITPFRTVQSGRSTTEL